MVRGLFEGGAWKELPGSHTVNRVRSALAKELTRWTPAHLTSDLLLGNNREDFLLLPVFPPDVLLGSTGPVQSSD